MDRTIHVEVLVTLPGKRVSREPVIIPANTGRWRVHAHFRLPDGRVMDRLYPWRGYHRRESGLAIVSLSYSYGENDTG